MNPATATLSGDGQAVIVHADYAQKDRIKAIPGHRWDPFARCWTLPLCEETLQGLRLLPCRMPPELTPPQPVSILATDTLDMDVQPVAPMPIAHGVKPYAHQVAAYNMALQHNAVALLHEQGCGKSLTTVAVAGRLYLDGHIHRMLIVAPLAVLPVWEREFTDYSTVPHHVTVLKSGTSTKEEQLQALMASPSSALDIVVVNYESIWRVEQYLADWRPELIVADESQRIKNPTAAQSIAMHRLGSLAKYRMILSGTPVNNTPLDLWSQYRFVAPDIFPRSYYAMRNRYAIMGGYGGYQIVGYRHLDELTRKAHSIAHRVTKAQALDLPEQVDQMMYCELEPKAAKAYKQLQRDALAEIGADKTVTAARVITRLLRLSQLTGGYITPDETSSPEQLSHAKANMLREVLEDLLSAGKKVVVFARFRAEITQICALCGELAGVGGYRAIWGDVPADERGEAVQAFQQDESVRLFVAQIQTAGLGITLTAADTAVFYSLDYSYANYEQCKARIHRIGQRNACTYIHLLVKNSVDEDVLCALSKKRDVADDIVDRWRQVFGEER